LFVGVPFFSEMGYALEDCPESSNSVPYALYITKPYYHEESFLGYSIVHLFSYLSGPGL
jgi:hypothetical protein